MRTLDIHECAAFLKIDECTAMKMAAKGKIKGAKVGRAWVFIEDDLAEYLRKRVDEQSALRRGELTQFTVTPPANDNRIVPIRKHRDRKIKLPPLPHSERKVAGA